MRQSLLRFATQEQLRQFMRRRSLWILAAMMIGLTFIHYFTPQVRPLPLTPYFLERHAVERIIFLMPIAGATFAFGQLGGVVTLVLSILLMVPRIFFMSPYPGDALAETVAVGVVGGAMIWMIETQENEKRLRQRAVLRLRSLNAVASILTESLQLEQILSSSLERVLQVMGMPAGALFLVDRLNQEMVLAASHGLAQADGLTCQFKMGQGQCGLVARSGEMMVIRDDCPAPCPYGLAAQKEGLRAQLIVPLRSKGEAQGVLMMADWTVRQFHPDELDLVMVIGNEIGVAIENARLHQDIARQLQIEQRLNQVAEEITSELELDNILPKVLKIAQELLNAETGGIALLDRDKNLISYPYLSNLPQELSQVTVPKDEGMAGHVIATGHPIIIENYACYPAAIPAFARAGLTGVLGVPIASGDQSYGVLFVGNLGKARMFSERDVAILGNVGRQAGIAIENAYLYENMRFYVRQITRAQEDERKRIARDLHDDTTQALVAFSRRLEALLPSARGTVPGQQMPATTVQRIRELQDQMDEVIKGVRRFSQALRPSVLDDLGLLPALEGLVSLTEQDGIRTRFQVVGEKRRFSPEAELTLFRIAQEALNNVRKHAQATMVAVTVEFADGAVRLTLQDNGKGFSPPALTGNLAASGKLGLVGMYERARLLGGTLQVQSQAGLGTRITVNVPT